MDKMIFKCMLLILVGHGLTESNQHEFPKDFLFGVATSAYQVEGAWNTSGKGENIWDHFSHTQPHAIKDGNNGDIACDSYHKVEEDVALLKHLGVDFYRFSLSWSRLLPHPLTNKVNGDGVRYYNELIDTLLKNNIQPLITIYHWDLPQYLQELGGWTNELVVEAFVEFARVAFENFGDRVKLWTTLNQPVGFCLFGYGNNILAPAVNLSGIGEYLCVHNALKAHAQVYHLYNETFKPKQGGRLSVTLNAEWYEPASDKEEDVQAADRALQFAFGWFVHPIFSKAGDYPKVMKKRLEDRSKSEGFTKSRLPKLTNEEIEYIKGTHDFMSINHYKTYLVTNKEEDPIGVPSFNQDMKVIKSFDPAWPSTQSPLNKIVPWGFSKLLKWIKENHGDVDIFITENGMADFGEVDDLGRIDYYSLYLKAVLNSIHNDGVRVKAYTAWSFMDNFEWNTGYLTKYGLYHVDFSSPNRTRTPKSSVEYFKRVIATRRP